jgi:peroxiredoxin
MIRAPRALGQALVGALCLGLLGITGSGARDAVDDLLLDLRLVPLDGKRPPAFTLPSLSGPAVSLGDLRGRVALLYFWASWCPYCTKELPSTIETVHRELRDRGLEVVAINMEESADEVAAWVREHKLTTRVLLDVDGTVSRAYQITGTPTVFLVGRDGRLVAKAPGTKPWASPQGRDLLRALLAR